MLASDFASALPCSLPESGNFDTLNSTARP
jgi:hypothetical protein